MFSLISCEIDSLFIVPNLSFVSPIEPIGIIKCVINATSVFIFFFRKSCILVPISKSLTPLIFSEIAWFLIFSNWLRTLISIPFVIPYRNSVVGANICLTVSEFTSVNPSNKPLSICKLPFEIVDELSVWSGLSVIICWAFSLPIIRIETIKKYFFIFFLSWI